MTPITNFSVQLDGMDISAIAATPFDLVVVESGYVGHDPDTLLPTPGFVAQLPPQEDGRLTLAYLNASVTDHNRAYWPDNSLEWLTPPAADAADLDTGTPSWNRPDPRVPDWLENNRGMATGPEDNGDGTFGFIVDWSDADWQARVIKEAVYLVKQGYSGIFLDDVGRYMTNHFFKDPNGQPAEFDQFGYPVIDRTTLAQYASEMMTFVTELSDAIKAVDSNAYLLINSGLDIVDHANLTDSETAAHYYAAVDGFLMEAQYAASVDGDTYNPWGNAKSLYGANATDLFALESVANLDDVAEFYNWAHAEGILGLATPSTNYANPPAVPPGTPEPENISGDDSITGTSAADNIQGGTGNDTITGGGHQDAIFGGLGDDNISGGWNEDTLVGGPGDDTISVTALVLGTYDFQYIYEDEEDLILPGLGHDTIFGTQGTTFTNHSGEYNHYASAILSYRDLPETGGLTLRVSPNTDYTQYFNDDFREFVGTVQSDDGRVDDVFTPVRTLEGSLEADLFELEPNVQDKFLVGHGGDDVFSLGSNASATLRYDRESAFNPNSIGIAVDFSTRTVSDTYGDVDQFSGNVSIHGTELGDLFDLRGAETLIEFTTGDGDDTILTGDGRIDLILSKGADRIELGSGGGDIRLGDWNSLWPNKIN
ncbi:hypothetical protein [Phaeobacter sp. J2-8]|uniref:hypothetical protein n=1 Tax=Phaeobacter sp. J2-8 TaxID=2931394 RepID=UPI001FD43C0F|nr:hypothetical protein [Phaeobacter sp. J2-8]MCJ7874856.1 hypothetical protein [Phaeobacter sp. J2-8]